MSRRIHSKFTTVKNPDGTTSKVKKVSPELQFYYKTLGSAIPIDYQKRSYSFFKNLPGEIKNYEPGSNPLPNNFGKVALLYFGVAGPNMGMISINEATVGAVDVIERIRNSATVTLKTGGDINHVEALRNILEPMPFIFRTTDVGSASTGLIRPPIQSSQRKSHSAWIKRSDALVVPFESPLPVRTNESLELELTIADGVTIPNSADGYYLIAYLGVEAGFSRGTAER
ncbi:hypothetical protein [Leptospira weilii]|uniref:Uncharacterized protein n=1 Tax=Leptospira weilii str. 2006001855 TaxID=996804 RepID=M6FND2_9LEPT|nr:hypothetical protein [Leptospira weilii]EMM71634.1 hypothetical protein LEP1GSC038_0352 [Leptospira weilii str. 2006001855]MCL8265545.1 hypothetical protein [Leptospira weilii]QDK23404.1 hypothetical protein FHG67_12245 [Leptospira weilii]QDK26954.1 hypothetical protein FHG68_10000 [Leptospira weilii]